MATQYGAAIRAPAKKSNLSSDDPQQQALLDAMGQNGAPDPQQSIDNLPSYQTAGPARTTMPVPTQQPQSPQVGTGVSSSGTLNGSSQSGPMTGPLGTRSSTVGGAASNQFPSGLPPGLTNGSNGYNVDPRAQQNSLNFLAPPTTGSISPQFPGVTPADLTNAFNQQTQQQTAATNAQSPAGGLGQFAGSMQGFDAGKLNDPNKHDPKYDFARAMSQFDPRQGVTPELLAKLNSLGYGQVSGSGDKVHIDNPSAAFNGLSDFDVVQGMDGGNGQWAWQPMGGDTGGGAPAQGGAAPQAQGDPLTQLSQLQTQASSGDGYSQMVLKYLMQQLGLDQGMLQHSQ